MKLTENYTPCPKCDSETYTLTETSPKQEIYKNCFACGYWETTKYGYSKVKCNNCEWLGNEEDLTLCKEGDENFKGCPNCKTDAHLTD